MKRALLVIDLQNDYFCGGAMELNGAEKTLEQTNSVIAYARASGYKIYFIQHFSTRKGATFFIPNTHGVELNANLDRKDELVIEKHYPNSFRETILQEELEREQIEELIVCGAMSHMCIDSTVRAGFDLGYSMIVVEDACATRDLSFNGETILAKEVHGSYMSALGSVFARVVDVKKILE